MARSAASKLPGDIEVSASMRTRPSRGVASRDLVDEFARMAECDVVNLGLGCAHARERLEPFVLERPVDRAQPVRPLRMAGWREMIEAGRMGDKQGRHRLRS